MALNTSKCNHLMPLRFKGLTYLLSFFCLSVHVTVLSVSALCTTLRLASSLNCRHCQVLLHTMWNIIFGLIVAAVLEPHPHSQPFGSRKTALWASVLSSSGRTTFQHGIGYDGVYVKRM